MEREIMGRAAEMPWNGYRGFGHPFTGATACGNGAIKGAMGVWHKPIMPGTVATHAQADETT